MKWILLLLMVLIVAKCTTDLSNTYAQIQHCIDADKAAVRHDGKIICVDREALE